MHLLIFFFFFSGVSRPGNWAHSGTAIGARTFLSAGSFELQRSPASSQAILPIERCCGQKCPRSDLVAV
jgi:hypothetical protein